MKDHKGELIVAIIGAIAVIIASMITRSATLSSSSNNYELGYRYGYEDGQAINVTDDRYDEGYEQGYSDGIDINNDGLYQQGYSDGMDAAGDEMYQAGYKDGYSANTDEIYKNAYDAGYQEGYLNGMKNTESSTPKSDGTDKPSNPTQSTSNSVQLNTLEIWQNKNQVGPFSSDSVTDNLGEEYYVYFTGDGWNSYKISGKYSTFCGRFAMMKEYNSYTEKSYIYVYGDDDTLLYSNSIVGGDIPIDFEVDISDVQILKIRISSETNYMGLEVSFLANAVLRK